MAPEPRSEGAGFDRVVLVRKPLRRGDCVIILHRLVDGLRLSDRIGLVLRLVFGIRLAICDSHAASTLRRVPFDRGNFCPSLKLVDVGLSRQLRLWRVP